MIRSLITSGCSFSEHHGPYSTVRCWPGVMSERFKFEHYAHLGMGSCGNDIIARKAIYGCTQALKSYDAKDILLIVMWSGLARKAFLTDNSSNIITAVDAKQFMGLSLQGSTLDNTVLDTDIPSWIWFNPQVTLPAAERWYLQYDNDYQQLENTLWNMIAVQSFCAQHSISYYWMTMNSELDQAINRLDKSIQELHINYLGSMLDRTTRIHPVGMYEWTASNTQNGFTKDNFHPNVESHRTFVTQVVHPYLESNNIKLEIKQ